jgi:hypothetical protein
MPEVGYISPGGDAPADDLASWAVRLRASLERSGKQTRVDVSARTPCDSDACNAALTAPVSMLFFFGHGNADSLLGSAGEPLIDESNLAMAVGKTLVSVACEAGLGFGPKAVQAGARAHLGWNVRLLWLAGSREVFSFGEAIVQPLSLFGRGSSVAQVADELQRTLNEVAHGYRQVLNKYPNAKIAYYAAAAAAGQIAVDGDRHVRPLSTGIVSTAVGWIRWRGITLARSALKARRGGSP